MRTTQVSVAALGTYLPEPVSARGAVQAGLYDEADLLDSGYTGSLTAGDTPAVEMAVRAARAALDRADLRSDDLGLVVHSGVLPQGPEMWSAPSYVLSALGGGRAQVMEVHGGCNGMLVALEVAAAQLLAYPERGTALLTTSDNVASAPFDRWNGGGPGFVTGDAGAAVVLTRRPGIADLLGVASTTLPELEGLHRGGEALHWPGDAPRRRIDLAARAQHYARHGGTLTDAVALIVKTQADLVHGLLGECDLRLDDVARLIYVNGSRYVMEQWVLAPLGLPMSRTAWDYGRGLGHVGGSDQVASLEHLLSTGAVTAGDHVLLLGGAPGFTVAAALLRITGGSGR
jgi:3-oxoacyl-[acyl-carrier-protein] synthase-3